jgi:hypothetical protein
MRGQQTGFAYQGLLCLGTQGLLHDLTQGEIEHHHPQEKHQHEG